MGMRMGGIDILGNGKWGMETWRGENEFGNGDNEKENIKRRTWGCEDEDDGE